MIIGKVTGTVVSTRKCQSLTGCKLLMVQINGSQKDILIAVDAVGAGIGENVLIATGSSARAAFGNSEAPVDALIVGIIDNEKDIYAKI